jgi:hypothetical protein
MTLKVWDAATGKESFTLNGHKGRVWSVAWSPDGKRIVSGSFDGTLKVWDVATGLETLTLRGHTGFVFSVDWSPDGKRLVSGSRDNTLRIWDATTSQKAQSLTGDMGTASESSAASYELKTETFLRSGEYAEAARMANLFHETDPANWVVNIVAVRFLARCILQAQKDAKLSQEQRAKLADSYGMQAVQLLDNAINRIRFLKEIGGLKAIESLKSTTDLDPLRKREDFQKLLADWDKNGIAGPKKR